jgi:hypothetical protein
MGVLDEAIRQHLELKRRRGADAGEIKREEDEALGEVRVSRGPGSERAEAESPVEEDIPQMADSEVAESSDRDSIAHQPTEAFDSAELAEALGQSPEAAAEVPQIAESELDEPAPPEPGEGPESSVEEPVAEEDTPTDEESEDDVDADELAETPEFLEDAPEHDKLWFEQKPPKDFDF